MRAIDGDVLFREMEKAQWYNNADRDEIAEELVLNAPTIEPEPHWIPCSERLPKEEGWYITTIENEKTGRRRIENDLFAIGIAEAHGNTPYKFCKDGHRQKTIAWMPLPEPYRGEGEK